MANHSSILAWKILWSGESGRLQTTTLQRIVHNRMTKRAQTQFADWGGGCPLYYCLAPLVAVDPLDASISCLLKS